MENISNIQKNCVGCRSCEQICPQKCITYVTNKEGFGYPNVDEKECIHCGICLRACPTKNTSLHRSRPIEIWAVRNSNDIEVMNSASGGAADLAAKIVIQQGGVVYGAAYDEKLKVNHIEVTDERGREKLQSSKYVQSDLKHCYTSVKRHLAEDKIILFTGLPCQIAGLYTFLGEDKPNLYTLDLICHGVPSPKLFQKYIEYQSDKMHGQVLYFNFRSKDKKGWGTQYLLKLKTMRKTMRKAMALDIYGKHFIDGDCYRECCYKCPYANTNRVADITVGDFWGIAKSHSDFYSPKGVSSVFVNTEKGQKLYKLIEKYAYVESITLEEGLAKQGNLRKPSNRPFKRDMFYEKIDEDNYIDKMHVGLQVKERIKNLLPQRLLQFLKSFQ